MTARVALVTGGGRGIGRAISLLLAADGFAVAVNYRRDAAAAIQTCEQVVASGARAIAYQASVDSPAEVELMEQQVMADFGRVDTVVCNAGIASRGRTLVDTDPAELARVMATHVFGAANVCRQFVPHLRKRGRSDVVVVSSVAVERAVRGGGPYMMAKVALEAFARTLAVEEMVHGVRVNIVAPGLVATEMGDRLARAVAGVTAAVDLDASSPFGRVCRPEDVANVISFLASEDSSYVSGQRIAVNRWRIESRQLLGALPRCHRTQSEVGHYA